MRKSSLGASKIKSKEVQNDKIWSTKFPDQNIWFDLNFMFDPTKSVICNSNYILTIFTFLYDLFSSLIFIYKFNCFHLNYILLTLSNKINFYLFLLDFSIKYLYNIFDWIDEILMTKKVYFCLKKKSWFSAHGLVPPNKGYSCKCKSITCVPSISCIKLVSNINCWKF